MYELHPLNAPFEVTGFLFLVGVVPVYCEIFHIVPGLYCPFTVIAFSVRKPGGLLFFAFVFVVLFCYCCFVLTLDITQCPWEGKITFILIEKLYVDA